MEPPMPTHDQTPLDSFRKEELEIFQSFENQTLVDINYYLWLNQAEQEEEAPLRFLYALELIFESSEALILSSGEDTEAIRVIDAQSLVDTARESADSAYFSPCTTLVARCYRKNAGSHTPFAQ